MPVQIHLVKAVSENAQTCVFEGERGVGGAECETNDTPAVFRGVLLSREGNQTYVGEIAG